MQKLQTSAVFLLFISLFTASIALPSSTLGETRYVVSGYVLDSSGHGLAGADVIFNVPQTVPGCMTNGSGYYQMLAPAGTYHVNVWPPYNSSYLNYDQPAYVVSANATENITLASGFKVAGYVADASGSPMVGASVLFKVGGTVYGSGYFTNAVGYYYAALPAGTYTIDAHPQTAYDPSFSGPCTPFQTYYEYNFAVSSDLYKNITVNTQAPTPTPSPTNQPAPTSTPTTNPIPTPHPTSTTKPLALSYLALQANALSYKVGSKLNLEGTLTDQNGSPLSDRTVVLSYRTGGGSSVDIGSDITNQTGQFSVQWLISGSGTFDFQASYAGDGSVAASEDSVTLSFVPSQDQNVFCVESNSTVVGLSFNSTSHELGFTVNGPSGTKGHTAVTVADSLVSDAAGFAVTLDGKPISYTATHSENYWTLSFNYSHSTHQVTIDLASAAKQNPVDFTILAAVSAAIIAFAAVGFIAYRHARKNL